MSMNKFVFGALIFLLLTGSVFAADKLESQLVVEPDEETNTLTISLLTFEPTAPEGPSISDTMREIITEICPTEHPEEPLQDCIYREGLERTAASEQYKLNLKSVKDAPVTVEYFESKARDFVPYPPCQNIPTSTPGVGYTPSAGGLQQVERYYAECPLSDLIQGRPKTVVRVVFEGDENINRALSVEYMFRDTSITPTEIFTAELSAILASISKGEESVPSMSTLPCVGIFLVLGLLLSSLYFAGKSPISLLDITTPRLPAPKGVTAGGQILMPFGYTELKRTTKAKMGAAASALTVGLKELRDRSRGDAALNGLIGKAKALKGTAADRAAGDVGEQKKILSAALGMGRRAGLGKEELEKLAGKLPYHWGEEEQRTIARILEKLEAMGGRERIMAMTLKDYVLSLRTFKSLETLTAHPDIGQRSAVHYRVSGVLGKMYGINRYAIIGGMVPSSYDSFIRTKDVMMRGTKATAKLLPDLARGTARSTMTMLGGRRAIEDLEAKAKSSRSAAWLHGQLTKHPSRVKIGNMFAVTENMGYLYNSLNDEAHRDSMRYILKRLYNKLGLTFNLSEEEVVRMGYTDLDILKRSKYAHNTELLKAEEEIRRLLANAELSSGQKLNSLMSIAERYGVQRDQHMQQMLNFTAKLEAINQAPHDDHIKLIMLQQELEMQNKVRMSTTAGGKVDEHTFVCHVGGDSLKGSQVWETMVLRTMIWDAEHGFLKGGIREELLSARLNVVNRTTGLKADDHAAIAQLPEHMRNANQLKLLADRNRTDMIQLFTEQGKKDFQKVKGKNINSASIAEVVDYLYGGAIPRSMTVDKATGLLRWWECDNAHDVPEGATLVDMKRHYVTSLESRENFAIGQWVESRTAGGKSYTTFYRASIEAELNRIPGSSSWSTAKRTTEMQKLLVREELMKDMENRFNSHFAQNTYGTTRETVKSYTGILNGYLLKALEEKGLSSNHPDMLFVQNMDHSSPKDLGELRNLMIKYHKEYEAVEKRDVTYDDLVKTDRAMVLLHERGYAYYSKGMMLSDADRIMAGEVTLRDNKGQFRKYVPDEVPVKFAGRDDLTQQYYKVHSSKDPNDWHSFIDSTIKWAKSGGYNYEREKVLGAVLWQYASATYDYEKFWKHSEVTVAPKRAVPPLAPSVMRFFGVEGHKATSMLKPFRDIALHGGSYLEKISLEAGGPLLTASWDITPTSEYMKQHSWNLASKIMSGRDMDKLTEAERAAYRAVAMNHFAFHNVWAFVVDRNPWVGSTSPGAVQNWIAGFQYGPGKVFDVRENLRGFMSRGEYMNFMATHGFALNAAGKAMVPYTNMIRGMQMSMQGYAARFDIQDSALRTWNYTPPRIREAMQAFNPFSYRLFSGRTFQRMAKLNVFGGSLEQHCLAGDDFMSGLRQAPQEVSVQKKGIYANLRTGMANPGASQITYRNELVMAQPMAAYLYREREAEYLFDKNIRDAALTVTQRRTVSAESLAIMREREMRGFGMMNNPLFTYISPVWFPFHMGIPVYPQTLTPRDLLGNFIRKQKYGHGESWRDMARGLGQSMASGTQMFFRPDLLYRQVYCGKCGRGGIRARKCACGTTLY